MYHTPVHTDARPQMRTVESWQVTGSLDLCSEQLVALSSFLLGEQEHLPTSEAGL